MKNKNQWFETKYQINKRGELSASSDSNYLSPSSWLCANIIAKQYEEKIPLYAKGLLLDLGCGFAPLFRYYEKYVSDCVCVDWENTLHKNPYLDLVCDITADLPFDDGTFDTVILSDVLEHIPNPSHLLSEVKRIVKDGGYIFLNSPFMYWIHESPFDYHRYTKYSYELMANGLDLTIACLDEMGGGIEVFVDVSGKLAGQIKILSPLVRLYNKLSYRFYRSKIGKILYNRTKHTLTLGYFIVMKKDLEDN